ncbi:hypothetical protein AaE_014104 [Aphanomyces astaci]|uniref:Uncharacterized protein n=1 Tax=Aphanomyces astaci TaxID=112090 RepID=A0A6A4Z502_APHAT|nr:hypothetical protein AaE_014104 [Aphanomyces astaci]
MTPVHQKLYQSLLINHDGLRSKFVSLGKASQAFDLEEKTCQYRTWFDSKEPRIHADRCYNAVHLDPLQFHDDVYTSKRFKLLYAAHVVPVPPEDLDNDPQSQARTPCGTDVNPPKARPKPKRRKRSQGMRN